MKRGGLSEEENRRPNGSHRTQGSTYKLIGNAGQHNGDEAGSPGTMFSPRLTAVPENQGTQMVGDLDAKIINIINDETGLTPND